jgi:hypothetical protein
MRKELVLAGVASVRPSVAAYCDENLVAETVVNKFISLADLYSHPFRGQILDPAVHVIRRQGLAILRTFTPGVEMHVSNSSVTVEENGRIVRYIDLTLVDPEAPQRTVFERANEEVETFLARYAGAPDDASTEEHEFHKLCLAVALAKAGQLKTTPVNN